eukprot:1154236-Pelagomonas_calceolata.AAC.7
MDASRMAAQMEGTLATNCVGHPYTNEAHVSSDFIRKTGHAAAGAQQEDCSCSSRGKAGGLIMQQQGSRETNHAQQKD